MIFGKSTIGNIEIDTQQQASDTGPIIREHRFACLPWQYEFLTDLDTFAIAGVGGIGSGKTHALMRAVTIIMQSEAGTRTIGGIFANTYSQLHQSVLPRLWAFLSEMGLEQGIDWVFNRQPPAEWGFASNFKKHDGVLTVRAWGQAVARSLDNPDAIRGLDLGWAVLDEARDIVQGTYDIVIGRLRCPKARRRIIRLTTTPNGYDWIYETFATNPTNDRRMIQMTTRDNDYLPQSFVKRLEESYDETFLAQEVDGKFVSLRKGQVYRAFDRKLHVVQADQVVLPRPDQFRLIVAVDFNRSPYCVCLLCELPDRSIAFDEIVMDGADTPSMFDEVARRVSAIGPSSVSVYGDASGNQRNTKSNHSDYDMISVKMSSVFGSRFVPAWGKANPAIQERIAAVNGSLKPAAGQPRIIVSSKCKTLIQDFEQVSYKKGSMELDPGPDKRLTHMSDAVSYYIVKRYPVPKSRNGGTLTFGWT
jgi:phage terminase large subunit